MDGKGGEKDLKDASGTSAVVLELRLDGTIQYLSASFIQLTGIKSSTIINHPISEIIKGGDEDKEVFTDAIETMKKQKQSYRIVFAVQHGDKEVTLEAQGMLVENSTFSEYALWILRPYLGGALSADINDKLKKAVGGGASVLGSFLQELRHCVYENKNYYPAPRYVLCRICEEYCPNWWFERHTDLCRLEHLVERRIIEAHDKLVEHRVYLNSLLLSPSQRQEYKGFPIPLPTGKRPRSTSGNKFAVKVSSPLASTRKIDKNSPQESTSDPLHRVLRMLLEVTDLALQIDIPQAEDVEEAEAEDPASDEIGETIQGVETLAEEEFVLSPPKLSPCDQGESPEDKEDSADEKESDKEEMASDEDAVFANKDRTEELLLAIKNFVPPRTRDPALSALCADTNFLIQSKAGIVLRMINFIHLSRRLLREVETQVNEAIHSTIISSSQQSDTALDDTDVDNDSESIAAIDTDDPGVLNSWRQVVKSRRRNSSRSSVSNSFLIPGIRSESPLGRTQGPSNQGAPSPSNTSPWQSPLSSPRLGPYPMSSSRSLNRGSQSHLPRDRSSSVASFEDSSRFRSKQAPSINDYEILSPISKGAFATVYLSKKKNTGELFAIKALKKSDVLEKNQVGNVRAERAILMSTADSPHVAKLYYTFQSQDYLYLVMEFVSGGDCASLLSVLVCLSEDWAKRYVAETIVAVSNLHEQGIIHRDLKPDNLLIDAKGHLKLSDFGLSVKSALKMQLRRSSSHRNSEVGSPSGSQSDGNHFVGTPDYLAPETINHEPQDPTTDWWSMGCILFEFLYGIPPFNDESPEKIFDNILHRRIAWPNLPPENDISPEAKDIINRLLAVDPAERLGSGGIQEIKDHPFFKDIRWDTLFELEPSFIPVLDNPQSTDYFDLRGAKMEHFSSAAAPVAQTASQSVSEEGAPAISIEPNYEMKRELSSTSLNSGSSNSGSWVSRRHSRLGESPSDDFGPFSYKNVSVLERQNHDLITKLKTESEITGTGHRKLSMSSPISPVPSGYWDSASAWYDSSPFASDTEESRNAAHRIHKRRLERKSFSVAHPVPGFFIPDILICISNPIWKYSVEKVLRDFGCQVVSCSTGEETIRRGTSAVKFDLILVDQHLSTGLQSSEIAQILQVTLNPNSSTPILLMTRTAFKAPTPFSGTIEVPITKENLEKALRTYCNWAPDESRPEASSSTHK